MKCIHMFRSNHVSLEEENRDVNLLLPNVLKLIQAALSLANSFAIISQIDNVDLDIFKGLLALQLISYINNILFTLCAQGYYG